MDKLALTTATKVDVETMTSELKQQTRIMIAETVDPLKSDMHDLKQRAQAADPLIRGHALAHYDYAAYSNEIRSSIETDRIHWLARLLGRCSPPRKN